MGILLAGRHEVSEFYPEQRIAGQIDVGLDEQGRRRASAHIGLRLTNLAIDIGFTSKLKRAQDTIGYYLKGVPRNIPVFVDERLNERHYGALEGRTKSELAEEYGEEEAWAMRRMPGIRPPADAEGNAETFEELAERTTAAMNELVLPKLAGDKNGLLVASQGNMIVIEMLARGMEPDEAAQLKIPNGAIREYEITPDRQIAPIE